MKSFIIVPLIKNRTGDTSDKGNYRPVAIVSACTKLLNVYCLASLVSTCARVTTNLGLRASILLTYVYIH